LLFGAAAALSAAKKHGATIAVFIVHEFVTELTNNTTRKQNAADLNEFVCALSKGLIPHIISDQLCGPLRVPGNDDIPGSVDLYFGEILRDTRYKNVFL
jgi:hypothetical protein